MTDPRAGIRDFLIEDRKIADYLLNLNHPRGGPKAARLLRHNFTPALLRDVLALHGRSGTLRRTRTTPYGFAIEVVDPVATPLNRFLDIRTVWEVRSATPAIARLVTIVFED